MITENNKKDPKAWTKLEKIGKEISKKWNTDKTSWQILT